MCAPDEREVFNPHLTVPAGGVASVWRMRDATDDGRNDAAAYDAMAKLRPSRRRLQ